MKTIITDENHYKKLDSVLVDEIDDMSRSQVVKMIRTRKVKVNGEVTENRNRILKMNDEVEYDSNLNDIQDKGLVPQDLKLDILFEDESLIVVNKAPGVVVHPGAGNWDGTVLNGVLFLHPDATPVAINRLDKETSGVLLIAKNVESREFYSKQFEDRTVEKIYLCVVPAEFLRKKITITDVWEQKVGDVLGDGKKLEIYGFIDRHPRDRKLMYFHNFKISESFDKGEFIRDSKKIQYFKKSARYANSTVSLISVDKGYAYLKVQLHTGRKHQIRAQFKAFDTPIVGDVDYGGEKYGRLMLHSYQTTIALKTGEIKTFTAPIPKIFNMFTDKVDV